MRLRCNKLFIFAAGLGGFGLLGLPDSGLAQEALQVELARIVVVQDFDVRVPIPAIRAQGIPVNMVPEPRSDTAQRWIRGIIQNELNAIEALCKPTPEQRQQLLDLAEKQWKPRLVTTIKAYTEAQNQRIPVDFEYRVERLVMTWVNEVLADEQNAIWRQEIEGRTDFRRRVVIGRMVSDVEGKLGLTASQMAMVADILKERWKDSWWSMYRAGTLPETKFAWISSVLSESQRTAGIDRTSQMAQQHFMQGGTVDLPSWSLNDRFEIGGMKSDERIPLHEADKEREDPNAVPVAVPGFPAGQPGGDDESD